MSDSKSPDVTDADIASVITNLLASGEAELQKMGQKELENHWFFRWDDGASLEINIYRFHDMLKLYGSFCRRWEEKHNGTCCVVERVRDTYLMPKVREFAARVRTLHAHDQEPVAILQPAGPVVP